MSTAEIAVVTAFDGRSDLVEAFVRRSTHEQVILLSPEDDDARRILHALRYEGCRIHIAERSSRLTESHAYDELIGIAAHFLRARWILRLSLDEILCGEPVVDVTTEAPVALVRRDDTPVLRELVDGELVRAAPPRAAPDGPASAVVRQIVRTAAYPGPAHKAFVAFDALPGRSRSVFVPLYGAADAAEIALTLESPGPAEVDIDTVRFFGDNGRTPPIAIGVVECAAVLRVEGVPGPPMPGLMRNLRTVTGHLLLIVDAAALRVLGQFDALELTITINPLRQANLLTSAALNAITRGLSLI